MDYTKQHWLDKLLHYRCLPTAIKLFKRNKKMWDKEDLISLFSEVYLSTHKHLSNLNNDEERANYIYTSYRNELYRYIKKDQTTKTKEVFYEGNKKAKMHLYLLEDDGGGTNQEDILNTDLLAKMIDYVRVKPINIFKSFDRTVFLKYYLEPRSSIRQIADEYSVSTNKIFPAIKRFNRIIILTFTNYDMKNNKLVKEGYEKAALLLAKIESNYPYSSVELKKQYQLVTGKSLVITYLPRQIKGIVEEISDIIYEKDKESPVLTDISVYPEPVELEEVPVKVNTEETSTEVEVPKKRKKKSNNELK